MDATCSLQCGWFAVHLLGLLAAWLVRVYEGRRGENALEALFLLCLAAVGVAALAGKQFCWTPGMLSAATLAVMLVSVVVEWRAPVCE
ncbi:MAG: hypothetical protein KDA61_15160 [Planctomycetales bacterium]|nr:hypothetical protein [Planctomycetales bacterium]